MAERKAFILRLSPELRKELQRMAAQELRSVNAQIEYLLRDAVAKRGRRVSAPASDDEEQAG
jgi:hypothetical protein